MKQIIRGIYCGNPIELVLEVGRYVSITGTVYDIDIIEDRIDNVYNYIMDDLEGVINDNVYGNMLEINKDAVEWAAKELVMNEVEYEIGDDDKFGLFCSSAGWIDLLDDTEALKGAFGEQIGELLQEFREMHFDNDEASIRRGMEIIEEIKKLYKDKDWEELAKDVVKWWK